LANNERAQRGVKLYRDQGVIPVSAEAALDALGRMMLTDTSGLLVMPARWEQFARSFENSRVPRAFLRLVAAASPEAVGRSEKPIRETLLATPAGRPRRTLLEAHLRETTAHVLKTSASRIDPTKTLGSMGIDSLMTLELVRRLAVTTGVRLPATAVFNYPTIVLLSEEIARRMDIPLDAEPPTEVPRPPARTASPAPAEVGISEEEAISALTGQKEGDQ
jgi:myxalamid-type polyketide synthase MxaE and MxaD